MVICSCKGKCFTDALGRFYEECVQPDFLELKTFVSSPSKPAEDRKSYQKEVASLTSAKPLAYQSNSHRPFPVKQLPHTTAIPISTTVNTATTGVLKTIPTIRTIQYLLIPDLNITGSQDGAIFAPLHKLLPLPNPESITDISPASGRES